MKMTSEQEIADTCMAYKVRSAARTITRRYDDALRPADLRSTQFTLLTVLTMKRKVGMGELSEMLSMERTTLLRNLKPLVLRGFVRIQRNGRPSPMEISISESGEAKFHEAIPLWQKAQARLKEDLGTEEFETALSTLGGFAKL